MARHNRSMAVGLSKKLFIGVLVSNLVVILAMGAAARFSFTDGFIGYLNAQSIDRMESMIPRFAAEYEVHGNWEFLRDNRSLWFALMRPTLAEREGEHFGLPLTDLLGIALRIALLDQDGQLVMGARKPEAATIKRDIQLNGKRLGQLVMVPIQTVTAPADVLFQRQQTHAMWIIGLAATCLAGLLSLALTRTVLAPIKRVAQATRQLAAGDYNIRVPTRSQDEVGQLSKDFNKLADALSRNEHVRRQFMADVSHELRTPISILRGEIEALQDGLRPMATESLASLHSEVSHLGKLVEDVYQLALSDVGALAYRMEPLDFREVLNSALSAYKVRFCQSNLTIQTSICEEPLAIQGDAQRLEQLICNLFENTARYTDAGGQVQIECNVRHKQVLVRIEDSAPGVPEPQRTRLFERFYRPERSRNRASGGSGLGLSICRNIIDAHQGQIEAHYSFLGGLAIVITLPLQEK